MRQRYKYIILQNCMIKICLSDHPVTIQPPNAQVTCLRSCLLEARSGLEISQLLWQMQFLPQIGTWRLSATRQIWGDRSWGEHQHGWLVLKVWNSEVTKKLIFGCLETKAFLLFWYILVNQKWWAAAAMVNLRLKQGVRCPWSLCRGCEWSLVTRALAGKRARTFTGLVGNTAPKR